MEAASGQTPLLWLWPHPAGFVFPRRCSEPPSTMRCRAAARGRAAPFRGDPVSVARWPEAAVPGRRAAALKTMAAEYDVAATRAQAEPHGPRTAALVQLACGAPGSAGTA